MGKGQRGIGGLGACLVTCIGGGGLELGPLGDAVCCLVVCVLTWREVVSTTLSWCLAGMHVAGVARVPGTAG